ncbi:four-domain proteases inhibitor [Aplysia californica]|uniref:Four-domain proteases inhibitor n=1 Tax=Aplysia californica TaxID=6500 RepID=A0ABM0JRY3_APLCA|nr:four-domain proteases inhibitor [Aplysia californica]
MKWLVLVLLAVYVGGAMSASCDALKKRRCTREYKPVCATFTRTFPTQCVLESMRCELAKQGWQLDKIVSKRDCCQRPITSEFHYVCGSDGEVYMNPMGMEIAACEKRDYIKSVPLSNCPNIHRPPGTLDGPGIVPVPRPMPMPMPGPGPIPIPAPELLPWEGIVLH